MAGNGDAAIFRRAVDLAVFSGAGGAGTSGTNDAGAFAAQVKKLRCKQLTTQTWSCYLDPHGDSSIHLSSHATRNLNSDLYAETLVSTKHAKCLTSSTPPSRVGTSAADIELRY